jgi:hypothetical protein
MEAGNASVPLKKIGGLQAGANNTYSKENKSFVHVRKPSFTSRLKIEAPWRMLSLYIRNGDRSAN